MTNPNLTIRPTHPDFIDLLKAGLPDWIHIECTKRDGGEVRFRVTVDVSLIETFVVVVDAPLSQDEAAQVGDTLCFQMWVNARTWQDDRLISAMKADKVLNYHIQKWEKPT